MSYVRSGFPQRKKKTGEQQYLKLLLKLTDISRQTSRNNLVQQILSSNDSENRKSFGPRLKMKNNLKWAKTRYCVNRDKEIGMFNSSVDSNKWRDHPSRI